MPVIKRVRFAVLSHEDMQQIENDIIKLERLSQRKENAMSNLRRKRDPGSRSPFGKYKSELKYDQHIYETLPSSYTKRKRDAMLSRQDESVDLQRQPRTSRDRSSRQPFKSPEHIMSRIERLEEGFDQVTKTANDVTALANNPLAFLQNIVARNPIAAKALGVALIVPAVIEVIMSQVEAYFGPGGGGDIRVQTLDAAKTIPDLDYLIAIRNNSVFFTSDTRVRSGLVDRSYSQNRGERERLYNELHIGSNGGSIFG